MATATTDSLLTTELPDNCTLRPTPFTPQTSYIMLPVGSGVVRIDPLRFLAGCRKRQLNQALSVLSLSLDFLQRVCCAVNYGPIFPLCYFVLFMCSVAWLFLLGCQYQCKWLIGKTRLCSDLLCVDGGVKPYSLTHSHTFICRPLTCHTNTLNCVTHVNTLYRSHNSTKLNILYSSPHKYSLSAISSVQQQRCKTTWRFDASTTIEQDRYLSHLYVVFLTH